MSVPETGARHRGWQPEVVSVTGRFVAASNATLLAKTDDGVTVVYKPHVGQRPLWDFDSATLAVREVLTYEVSRRLGLGIVPETVMSDGPHGPGSVQRFVEADPDFDPLTIVQAASTDLWPFAFLDVITNNADRKLGHILRTEAGLVAIDHGLTFHSDDKLRTVLWFFAGTSYPPGMVEASGRLADSLAAGPTPFDDWLTRAEVEALQHRLAVVAEHPVHPEPPDDRPPVPWPPY